jgi:hypothetical protein
VAPPLPVPRLPQGAAAGLKAGVIANFTGVTVSTLVGSSMGFANGVGAAAKMAWPVAVAKSHTEEVLYIAEEDGACIRKFDLTTGELSLFAGVPGRSGNRDGPALEALFGGPQGLAVDKMDGSLVVIDTQNSAIRRVRSGAVTTIPLGHIGAGWLRMRRKPIGVAISRFGTIYVTDSNGHSIIQIENGEAETVAGTGRDQTTDGKIETAAIDNPRGIVIDPKSGDDTLLFVASNEALRRVNLRDSTLSAPRALLLHTSLRVPTHTLIVLHAWMRYGPPHRGCEDAVDGRL